MDNIKLINDISWWRFLFTPMLSGAVLSCPPKDRALSSSACFLIDVWVHGHAVATHAERKLQIAGAQPWSQLCSTRASELRHPVVDQWRMVNITRASCLNSVQAEIVNAC